MLAEPGSHTLLVITWLQRRRTRSKALETFGGDRVVLTTGMSSVARVTLLTGVTVVVVTATVAVGF